jgi:hypothetical protein
MMTRSEEAHVFRLLDEYSRRNHRCFVAEFFSSTENDEYVVCFRPVADGKFSADEYACRYLSFETPQLRMAHIAGALLAMMAAELDRKLPEINPIT